MATSDVTINERDIMRGMTATVHVHLVAPRWHRLLRWCGLKLVWVGLRMTGTAVEVIEV